MAEQRIANRDGSITVIDAPTIEVGGVPAYQEDPSRYEVRTVSESDVCQRYGATPDELRAWEASRQFPAHHTRKSFFWSWSGKRERVSFSWLEVELDAWDDEILALAARIPRKR